MSTSAPSHEPLHERVAERIKSLIARNYSPGDLLPKYRELAKWLDVSLPTVSLAMRLLAERGIVKPVRRKGTFVSRELTPRDMRLARIGLVLEMGIATGMLRSYSAGICGRIFERAEELRAEIQLSSVRGPYEEGRVNEILESGVDGIILVGVSREDYLRDFARVGIPVVVADHDTRPFGIPCAVCDEAGGCELLVKHLAGLGHRHIAYVERMQTDWQIRGLPRRQGFSKAMQAQGLKAYGETCLLQTPWEKTPASTQLLRDLSDPNGPTAVVADHENTIQAFLQMLARRKLRVPRDISVAAAGGSLRLQEVPSPMTRCQFEFTRMGELAFDLLERACVSPSSVAGVQRTIPPILLEGSTTGRARRRR